MSFFMPDTIAEPDLSVRPLASLHDKAIDKAASDVEKYAETFNLKHLTAHAGMELTLFDVKPLSSRQLDAIAVRHTSGTEMALAVFTAACLRAHNVVHKGGTGDEYTATVEGKHLDVMPIYIRMDLGSAILKISDYVPPGFFGASPVSSSTDSGD